MTTIAYKDGVIAYDSLATRGGVVFDFDADKHHQVGEAHLFIAGSAHDVRDFLDAYQSGSTEKDLDIEAILVEDNNIYLCSTTDAGDFWRCKIRAEQAYAIGSGSDFALTAMDMGATAEESVIMASKRDINTGGKIRTYEIQPLQKRIIN